MVGQRERQQTKREASLSVTTEKLAVKQKELADTETKLAEAQKTIKRLNGKNKALSEEYAELVSDIASANEDIRSLDEERKIREEHLTDDLIAYKEAEKAKIEAELVKVVDEITSKSATSSELDTTLNDKRAEVAVLIDTIAQKKHEAERDYRMKHEEAEMVGSTLEELQRLVDEAKQTLKDVQYARDKAMAQRDTAQVEHERFLKYEKVARGTLDAKDRSLQERESELSQNEQFMKNRRSFLPEM